MKTIWASATKAAVLFFLASLTYAATPTVDSSLQSTLDKYRNKYKMPGVALSVKLPGDNSIKDYFSGVTAMGGTDAINKDSLFQIGGVSKSFTAAVILQLEAEGKLNLNDNVGKWLTQFPDWSTITLKQLLNETSGIFDYMALPNFVNQLTNAADSTSSNLILDDLANMAYQHKPNMAAKPGQKWAPSNTNYALLGMVIQKVTGHGFQDEINQRLLNMHTGLTNTFYFPYPQAAADRLVHGYEADGTTDVSHFNMSWGGPAAGLISTSHDMVQWSQDLFTGKILQAAQMTEMTTLVSMKNGQPLKAGDYNMGVGLGIEAGADAFDSKYGLAYGYNGNTLGYRAQFIYLPCYDITLAVTINNMSQNAKDMSAMMADLVKILTDANKPQKSDQLPAVCKKLK